MWYVVPRTDMNTGLNSMDTDNEVMNMAELGMKHGMIYVYAEAEPKEGHEIGASQQELVLDPIKEVQAGNLEDQSDQDSDWEGNATDEDTDLESDDDNEEYIQGRKLKQVQLEVENEACIETDLQGQSLVPVEVQTRAEGGTSQAREKNEADASSGDEVVTPENSDDEGEQRSNLKMFNENTLKQDIRFEVGLAFENREQFQQAMADYCMHNGVAIIWRRSCQQRLEAICKSKGCKWRVHASWTQNHEAFAVKVISPEHNCCRASQNYQASSKWIARHYLERFRANEDWPVSELMNDINEKFAVSVSRTVCYKARALARSMIRGSLDDHYQLLPTYLNELNRVYPDSRFELVVDRTDQQSSPRFKRFYSCFDGLREGFRHGCRSVIGLDGCFLKTPMGGILLSAVGRDGNNQMYPFAWAVVESENESSWRWFLEHLKVDLNIDQGLGWVIISDQQKGLENAVRSLLPLVEHRNCARHLYANWKKKHPGLELRSLFWRAVKATNQQVCRATLDQMRLLKGAAYDDFTSIGLHKFCRAFIGHFNTCDAVDNNICECFNNYILPYRSLPIIDMLEAIRTALMNRIAQKKGLMNGSTDDICPRIRKRLEENKLSCRSCLPTHAGKFKFQVDNGGHRYVVSLDDKSCSCGQWDVSGIPCIHSISCIIWLKGQPELYVDDVFKREMYMQAYQHHIQPLNGKDLWVKVAGEKVLPPVVKRQAGRPKKQRKRCASEVEPKNLHVLTRKGMKMKCPICKQYGHSSRFCKVKGQGQASSSGQAQVRKRGRPPKVQKTSEGTGPTSSQTSTSQQQQHSAPQKLQVRRRNNQTPMNPSGDNEAATFHRELAKVKKGFGVLHSEDCGTTFYVMPGQRVRTSYMGRLEGQFSQQQSETSHQQSGSSQLMNTNQQSGTSQTSASQLSNTNRQGGATQQLQSSPRRSSRILSKK